MSKIEVICGPMFAGKTEELIRRVKRYTLAHAGVQVFKPSLDHRYGVEKVTSHSKTDLEVATGVKPVAVSEKDRLKIADETVLVGFDEVQFFEKDWIVPMLLGMRRDGIHVLCAGLDLNTYGEPFGCMPHILSIADEVYKLKAVCECGNDAGLTYRSVPFSSNGHVEIGGSNLYEPRCFKCWIPTPRVDTTETR